MRQSNSSPQDTAFTRLATRLTNNVTRVMRQPGGMIGCVLIGLIIMMTLLSFLWTPFDPTQINIDNRFIAPGLPHIFGTDHFGRDILSMIMVGGRTSLAIAFGSVGIGLLIGVPLGLLAASGHRLMDQTVMRINDVLFALPSILLAILFTAIAGPGVMTAIIAIGIFNIPVFARVTRGSALTIWSQDYVAAARTFGGSLFSISRLHILPNILPILLVQIIIQMSVGITAEAGLSYVGLGAQPPLPSWGRMLNEAQTMTAGAPWLAIAPGLAIILTVLGLSLISDLLTKALAPAERKAHPSGMVIR